MTATTVDVRPYINGVPHEWGIFWVCTDCMLEHANGESSPDRPADLPEPWSLWDTGSGSDREYGITMGLLAEEHADDCDRNLAAQVGNRTYDGRFYVCPDGSQEFQDGYRDAMFHAGRDLRDGTESLEYDDGYDRALHDREVYRAQNAEPVDCDCETREFSRSSCDGCGCELHGTRHAFAWWKPVQEGE